MVCCCAARWCVIPFPSSVVGENQGVETTKVRYEALVGGRQLVVCAAVCRSDTSPASLLMIALPSSVAALHKSVAHLPLDLRVVQSRKR